MAGLQGFALLAQLRRLMQAALLAVGMLGIGALMLADATSTLARGPAAVPVVAAPVPGMLELTLGPQMDGFAAWSSDGKRIAFMRDGRIFAMNATGGGIMGITKSQEGWDLSPVWRPDGKQIAFIRLFPDRETAQIITVDPSGGREKVLVEERAPIGYLAWGPKTSAIYYTLPRTMVKLSGGKRSLVLTVGDGWELAAGGLALRSDETEVIYGAGSQQGQGTAYDLWLLALGRPSAVPEQLTRGGGIMPAYHPGGALLAYRNPREKTGVYLMDLKAHTTRRILADTPQLMYFHPAFAPDGSRLAVSGLSLAGLDSESKTLASHLFVLKVATSD